MDKTVMDDIPIVLDMNLLVDALRLKNNLPAVDAVTKLANDAMHIGRPKALYKVVQAEYHDEDRVVIDGTVLHSSLLKANLCRSDIVLPYLCTCGKELEEWSMQFSNIVQKYWVDTILTFALGSAMHALETSTRQRYHPRRLSSMNPGSLTDWPIQEQKNLFRLFGDDAGFLGVTLTEGLMMKPLKSLSGIFFASDEGFINCQLCSRAGCPDRRAPYQKSPVHSAGHNGCDA
jgi:hypothetical protein